MTAQRDLSRQDPLQNWPSVKTTAYKYLMSIADRREKEEPIRREENPLEREFTYILENSGKP